MIRAAIRDEVSFEPGNIMADALRIALAGLGTVGGGVIKLLEANRDLIARRAGRPIEVVAVSARDRSRDRGVDLSGFAWVDDAAELASRADIDVVVELIGGSDGPALTLAKNSIEGKKAFVTANKAMIAHHGLALAAAAEAGGTAFKYEAAVAGGIPVIKGLREGAAANEITQVYGILNGTCNYILTTMESQGRDFGAVLSDAQALGYAEADPAFDVDGIDAAHKLSILASLSFGTRIDFDAVATTGIRNVLAGDIAQAKALGFRVRLVGRAEAVTGGLLQSVQPCLVPVTHPLAHVAGAMNAVVAHGNFVGRLFFEGRGAGEGPTASAVVADLIDIARLLQCLSPTWPILERPTLAHGPAASICASPLLIGQACSPKSPPRCAMQACPLKALSSAAKPRTAASFLS
jgi:homoserine dehydrogenase